MDETKLSLRTLDGHSRRTIIIIAAINAVLILLFSAMSFWGGGFAVGNGQTAASKLSWPVIIHLATVIPAIPLGGYILWRKKGDRVHKALGKLWAGMMMVTALVSFAIGQPGTGVGGTGLSFIHIFSVVTVISIPLGIWAIRRGNIRAHYQCMQGPYIGLFIAGFFAFMPGRLMHILVFDLF